MKCAFFKINNIFRFDLGIKELKNGVDESSCWLIPQEDPYNQEFQYNRSKQCINEKIH